MEINKKCIIDNWSLEHAGFLLNDSEDIHFPNDESFENNLGGLSNFINALLLYENSCYLINGFENEWARFKWFEQNTSLFLTPLNPDITNINWTSELSYSDNGIKNYLITSDIFNADLFISPERSSKIINQGVPKTDTNLIRTLKRIDESISKHKDKSWYDNVKIGIENNFILPSLTHYILSEASSMEDLLTVIVQLKTDGKISRIKSKIDDLTSSTKSSMKFQNEINNIIIENLGMKSQRDRSWSVSISVLFLSLSKAFNFSFFNRKEHLIFLKNMAAIRAENRNLQDHIERIFKRKIK